MGPWRVIYDVKARTGQINSSCPWKLDGAQCSDWYWKNVGFLTYFLFKDTVKQYIFKIFERKYFIFFVLWVIKAKNSLFLSGLKNKGPGKALKQYLVGRGQLLLLPPDNKKEKVTQCDFHDFIIAAAFKAISSLKEWPMKLLPLFVFACTTDIRALIDFTLQRGFDVD